MTTEYRVHLSDPLERRLAGCRVSVRDAIRRRLRHIAAGAAKTPRSAKAPPKEPAPRFYVYEGYRIMYELDVARRRVVVLGIELLRID